MYGTSSPSYLERVFSDGRPARTADEGGVGGSEPSHHPPQERCEKGGGEYERGKLLYPKKHRSYSSGCSRSLWRSLGAVGRPRSKRIPTIRMRKHTAAARIAVAAPWWPNLEAA